MIRSLLLIAARFTNADARVGVGSADGILSAQVVSQYETEGWAVVRPAGTIRKLSLMLWESV
jgi:hypothetical protein